MLLDTMTKNNLKLKSRNDDIDTLEIKANFQSNRV